jgi:hypothetical protein
MFQNIKADVAELVDALDLGPSNFCFESSSLSIRNSSLLSIQYLLKFINYSA